MLIIMLLVLVGCLFVTFIFIPAQANRIYGSAAPSLGFMDRIRYSTRLLWYDGLLTRPLDPQGTPQSFMIEEGESVDSIANKLQVVGLIRDAEAFRAYLIYSGLDTSIRAGEYEISAAMSAIDVARSLQDPTPGDVTFVILPGWRIEEIATSLETSGLAITPDQFVVAAHTIPSDYAFLDGALSTEGFLYPDTYVFPRESTADQLVQEFVRNFGLHLGSDVRSAVERQGFTVYQAVVIASLVEREAIRDEEKPIIASVFLNRLKSGMKLDSDPTVQYALGYDLSTQSWWKNPLSLEDLQFGSPYNTYIVEGLPPTPIDNPSLASIHAVAFPAETNYFFFRARCDGSGLHEFAATFEEHLQNACP